MSASSSWELQRSVHAALVGDPALTTLLGGARVYDDTPQAASLPYVTLGETSSRDWGTATEDGEEHILTLHVWSEASGRKEAQQIIGAIRTVLHEAALPVDGHTLVNLRHEFSDARRDPEAEIIHGIVRYRAVTERSA